jgi:23S rRNA pseudouridine2605 synthase
MDQRSKGRVAASAHDSQSLVKYLVNAGLGSRRGSAALIMAGQVRINGHPADSVMQPVESGDLVMVDGREIVAGPSGVTYLLLHKPDGYLSTARDDRGRRTVMDLVPEPFHVSGLVPVGRLDLDSTGLLLLTNDGDLVHRLTHPRYGVEKEYHVMLDGPLASSQVRRLLSGVKLPEGMARAVGVRALTVRVRRGTGPPLRGPMGRAGARDDRSREKTAYSITLVEGQKREVKLLFYSIGRRVSQLRRVRMGTLRLGTLQPGQARLLTPIEVQRLKELVAKPATARQYGPPPKSQA